MNEHEFQALRVEWEHLLAQNRELDAQDYYFRNLLSFVVARIRAQLKCPLSYKAVISLLGFATEPTVICAQVVQPEVLVVLHTPETRQFLDTVREFSNVPAARFHHEPFEHGPDNLDGIYFALSRALERCGKSGSVLIELTGGKKTTSVQLGIAAAILEKRGGRPIDLCQIGFSDYLPKFRKPVPETSYLELISNPIDAPMKAFGLTDGREGLLVNPIFQLRSGQIEKRTVFVLMPFGCGWPDDIWRALHTIVSQAGLRCSRADSMYGPHVLEDIWKGILQAEVVIADTTGRNPNVFYEIGIAHTLGKRVILLAQEVEDIPFDLRVYRVLTYQNSPKGINKLHMELPNYLRAAVSTGGRL